MTKADTLRKLAKDYRLAGHNKLADRALILLAKETGSATPRSDLSYSYIMRKLHRGDKKRMLEFMTVFKQAFDKAYAEDLEDCDNIALMQAIQTTGFKDE